mgnify:CR=1 FL=1
MILGIDGRLANARHPAGAGRYCRELLRAMGALAEEPTLRIYLDEEPHSDFPKTNGEIRVLPRCRFWLHRALAKELRRDTPDVFFSPVAQLPWRCPCPALVSVLDLAVCSHPDYFPWRKRLGMRLKTSHAIRGAGHLVAISESTATSLGIYYGVARENITVVPLGIADHFLNLSEAPATTIPGLPDRFVLYVGQVQPRKNLVRLIEAFTQVCTTHPELPHHLVLAGADGWQAEATHRAIAASPLSHRIYRLGYVPEDALAALMAKADVLALVSLWEGFGLPVAEAMAVGTAVLTSNVSSLPEIVGDAGVTVAPDDTGAIAEGLERLLTDEGLRKQCEERGHVQSQQFRWENTAEKILAAARRLGQNRP